MGDVAEGSGVDQGRLALAGLHHIRHSGVAQQGHQRANYAQLFYGYGLAAASGSDHQAAQTLPQIFRAGGQGQDSHYFRGGYDVEPGFAQRAVVAAPHAGNNIAQRPVGSVGYAGPLDAGGFEVGNLLPENGVVHQGGQQVVGRSHGVGVAGEVDVYLVFRHHRGLPAAGAAALDAEDWAEGGFPQGDYCFVSQLAQPLGQADGGGGLAFAGGRGGHAGNHNQLSLLLPPAREGVQRYLGFVMPVRDQVVGRDT